MSTLQDRPGFIKPGPERPRSPTPTRTEAPMAQVGRNLVACEPGEPLRQGEPPARPLCALCGEPDELVAEYRLADAVLRVCEDCLHSEVQAHCRPCRGCGAYFRAPDPFDRLCPPCDVAERDAWWGDHPDGQPHFYERRQA